MMLKNCARFFVNFQMKNILSFISSDLRKHLLRSWQFRPVKGDEKIGSPFPYFDLIEQLVLLVLIQRQGYSLFAP